MSAVTNRVCRGALLALVIAPALVACSADDQADQAPTDATAGGSCAYPADGRPAKPVDPPPTENIPAQGEVTYTLAMAAGDVTITMDRATAPCAVNSFDSLVAQGYFDNTRCHRLTEQGIFVLQCGDPTATGTGGPGYSFADEPGGEYTTGTVAMANAGPDTNGSQFFLVYDDSPLPPDYTILGHMDDASVEVVRSIAAGGSDNSNGAGDGQPVSDASIRTVTKG